MPTKNDQSAPLDLNDAIDSLLGEIEETTRMYAPPEEQAINADMLITDDGTAVAPPVSESTQTVSNEETDEKSGEAGQEEPIDSIENAKQALEALDDVETQAEDLVAQSIDALLENTETVPEPEPVPESEPSNDVSESDESDDSAELTASIDQLLEDSDTDDHQESPSQSDAVLDDAHVTAPDNEALSDEAPSGLESIEAPSTEDTDTDASIEDTLEEPPAVPEQSTQDEPDPVAAQELTDEAVTTESADAQVDGPAKDSMDLLDNALAEAADDMLEGDFETEEGELVTGEAVASAIEKTLEAQQDTDIDSDMLNGAADDLLDCDTTPIEQPAPESVPQPTPQTADQPAKEVGQEQVQESPPQTAPEATDEPANEPSPAHDPEVQSEIESLEDVQTKEPQAAPAWFERFIEIIRPKIDKIDPLKGKSIDALAMVLGTVIVTTMTHTTPIAARIMILVSKPLAKQSPEIRNAAGYIALWTGFLAVVLWVYLLMFRAPIIPHPEAAPSRVINADESLIIQPVIGVLP